MKKEVHIPNQTMVIDQAEALADMEASQKGFKRGSERWKKTVKRHLDERYYNSSIPHNHNPIKGNVKESRHLKSAKTYIVRTILKYKFNLTDKDFNYPKLKGITDKEMRDRVIKRVDTIRYIRDLIEAMVDTALEPVINVERNEVIEFLKSLNIDGNDVTVTELKKKKRPFNEKIREVLKVRFGKESPIKTLMGRSTNKKKMVK